MFTYQQEIETKLRVYKLLLESQQQFRDRFIPDPLSMFIVNNVSRFHKLEALFLAITLLRYSDCHKINREHFFGNSSQTIQQGKTKTEMEVPPLFLTENPSAPISFPAVTLFTDSYNKINYALQQAIPSWIKEALKTERSVTHIFRFLRASFYHCKKKDFYLISKYLGHKDPESLASYVPPGLLKLYSSHLSKG